MSTPQSGPPDQPGQPTDTGEFRSQQGVELGYVAVLSQQIMPRLAEFYTPEYEEGPGNRRLTQWIRGGIPGHPTVNHGDPELQPNWYIGEEYLANNTAPQSIVFARANVPIQFAPTPMVGSHVTGYRQIYNAIMTLTVRILSFNDDDGWELMNYLVAAAWRETVGSTESAVAENLIIQSKDSQNRGTQMDFSMKIGIPIFLPPRAPACVERVNQQSEIAHGPIC